METKLYADLQALNIPYDVVEHPAVFTVEESRAVDGDIPGAHTKNLFLKDAGGRFWLVTVPAALRADLKALPAAMGAKRVSFGKGEDMERLIGVTPGSVTPLGAIADADGAVTIVLDASLAAADRVNCHPLRNTATLGLSGADLVRALTHWGHPPIIIDVPAQD
jgi:Ala-tRNA(Pro) deacylase